MAKIYVSRSGRKILTTKGDFERRNDLPYGIWICIDGREVLFNRFYEPMLERWGNTTARAADPHERVKGIASQDWFYNDGCSEMKKRRAGQQALSAWTNLSGWGVQAHECGKVDSI